LHLREAWGNIVWVGGTGQTAELAALKCCGLWTSITRGMLF